MHETCKDLPSAEQKTILFMILDFLEKVKVASVIQSA